MKKKHPEHVNLERWLVSYADFITLLFAFFVVMYAISQADIAKFRKVAEGMRAAFSGGAGLGGGNTLNGFDNPAPEGGREIHLPNGKANVAAEPDPGMVELRDRLEESISLEVGVADLADKMRLEYDARGLVVSIALKDLYQAGHVDLNPDLLPLVDRVGKVLAKSHRQFRIEGYADEGDEGPAGRFGEFGNAWTFSCARAAWLLKHWVDRVGLDPASAGATGYGTARPVTNSAKNSDLNRRVEIVVLNQSYAPVGGASPEGEK